MYERKRRIFSCLRMNLFQTQNEIGTNWFWSQNEHIWSQNNYIKMNSFLFQKEIKMNSFELNKKSISTRFCPKKKQKLPHLISKSNQNELVLISKWYQIVLIWSQGMVAKSTRSEPKMITISRWFTAFFELFCAIVFHLSGIHYHPLHFQKLPLGRDDRIENQFACVVCLSFFPAV